MSGYLGGLSAEQEAALKQLKERCQDLLTKPEHDDRYCLRWLRARAFNVKKAEDMLRKHFVWRAENKVDTILEDFKIHPVVDMYLPRGLLAGADKDGRPVEVQMLGEMDLKGMLKCVSTQDVLRAHVRRPSPIACRACPLTRRPRRFTASKLLSAASGTPRRPRKAP